MGMCAQDSPTHSVSIWNTMFFLVFFLNLHQGGKELLYDLWIRVIGSEAGLATPVRRKSPLQSFCNFSLFVMGNGCTRDGEGLTA